MLLGWIYGPSLPQYADFNKEWVNDIEHGFLKSHFQCILRKDFFESLLIQINHGDGKCLNLIVEIGGSIR